MLIVARVASNVGLTGSRQLGMATLTPRIDLRGGVLSVHAMACSAVRRANAACQRKDGRVPALIELRFLRRMARSTQARNFLRTGNAVWGRTAGGFAVLDTGAVTGVATQ